MKKTNTIKTDKKPSLFLKAIINIYIAYRITKSYLGNTIAGRFTKRIYNLIAIQFCIMEAKSLHRLTDKQYYVLKVYGKIRVKSAIEIKYNRRKRVLSKSLDYYKLQEMAIFKTK